ncbi:hypothetical protein EVJ27_03455 [Exiguobacterium sp. SH3S2]|uniref:hypothetical protein n=1 Tax=unclassified Exiguobacterium TaxID=2644629 RepID=UPI00103CBED2|nr:MULTISPECIES: hypothetical protein [unclassified Exiguobacterium]TCI47194.1 hypothetical protein EVJ28_03450 [Exiguobacterium sp. SH3S3]TCI51842.1 hypothetical protein EVJ30_10850 [Exiguobacterium sp. SH5S13]TCI62298.1 hypothetical protein EVJ26_08910 [Exiguobacterium sp. SH3S1]TCI62342.1 hypothetical protein EVJ27_03455 [Exiguobacterium sp. SH3S2]
MLSWLGITNADKTDKTERQFFGNVKKKTITLILLTALIALYGVKAFLTYLIPASYLDDALVAVLPGTVGVLVSLVYVLILERVLQDEVDNTER